MSEKTEKHRKNEEKRLRKNSRNLSPLTCSGVARFLQSAPGVTIEGLSRMPSKMTPWSAMYL